MLKIHRAVRAVRVATTGCSFWIHAGFLVGNTFTPTNLVSVCATQDKALDAASVYALQRLDCVVLPLVTLPVEDLHITKRG